jgi:hypothetical protein
VAKSETGTTVRLDLNSPVFQENLLTLQEPERLAALDALGRLRQMRWSQVYRDKGLNLEKILSVRPPAGVDAIYSLRITQSRRATVRPCPGALGTRFPAVTSTLSLTRGSA